MFLTDEELVKLTGYVQPAAQIRWLKKKRYRYDVNGAGHVVIARAWITPAAANEPTAFEPERQRPNLRALPGKA